MPKKYIILFTVFVDILGIGIVVPVLPYYVQSFSTSALAVTSLYAVFALCSFLSAPFLGALSDKIGRRPVLLVSIASTAVGWLVFASAGSLLWLFVGRIIDGLAAGNLPIAQSYLTDLATTDQERSHNLGLIGSMFGLGFIIGPAIGGLLAHYGASTPFWFAGGLAVVNLLLAFKFLPETHHNRNADEVVPINPFTPIIRALKNRPLLPGFAAWFLFGCAAATQYAVFALYLQTAFNFGSGTVAWFLVGMGVILSLNQAIFLKRIWLKKFSEPLLELVMLAGLSASFALLTANSLTVFIIGVVSLTISSSVLRVVMTSQIVALTPNRRGEILGILASIMSVSMIAGPALAGVLFEWHSWLPFAAAAATSLVTFVLVLLFKKRFTVKNLPDDTPAVFPL